MQEKQKCKISNHSLSFDKNTSNSQNQRPFSSMNSLKKENSLKWVNNIKKERKKPDETLSSFVLESTPLDFSNYKPTKKFSNNSSISSNNLSNPNISIKNNIPNLSISKSSTFETVESQQIAINLYDSLLSTKSVNTNDEINNGTVNQTSQIISEFTFLKTYDDNFIGDGQKNIEPEYIYDNSIRITKFISEGAQAKIYMGIIEEIDKEVAVKRYEIDYNEDEINRIFDECEIVKQFEHPNIIKYFDIEIKNCSSDDQADSMIINIDIIMEFFDGINIKEYMEKHGSIPIKFVKLITIKILEGLTYLHSKKIIHRDLKPENVLLYDDLTELKIVDFGICTKVKESETFRKRTALGTPYYMAPEVISEKPYAFEADIWSLGCIVYELVSGVKPYGDMTPYHAMFNMIQYTSPLEYADDRIKDIFYDKSNRDLLDFLQKCWRPNNSFRPSAVELLTHKFLIKNSEF